MRNTLPYLLLCLAPGLAFGDATVIRTLKLEPHTQDGLIDARSVIQVRGSLSRRETEVVAEGTIAADNPFPRNTITLISLDAKQVHTKTFPNDTYVTVPLAQWTKYVVAHSTRSLASEDAPWHISQSWSRVIPEDDVKTIDGFACTKFTYEWRFETQNAEGYAKKQYVVRTTLWLAELTPDFRKILAEEGEFQKGYHERLKGTFVEGLNGVTMQYAELLTGVDKEALFTAITEGTTHLKKIIGYPIASQTEWERVGSQTNKPLFTVESQLESISMTPIADALFLPVNDPNPLADLPDLVPSTPLLSRAN